MTRTRNEVVFTRKGEKPWIKTDKIAIVLIDDRGQIIKPDLPSTAAPLQEGVNMTANKTLEALAMCKLQEHLAAMAVDQTESVEFPGGAVISECSEVAPVHIESLTGTRLDPHVRSPGNGLNADCMKVILNDCDTAVVAEWAQMLRNHRRIHGGIHA